MRQSALMSNMGWMRCGQCLAVLAVLVAFVGCGRPRHRKLVLPPAAPVAAVPLPKPPSAAQPLDAGELLFPAQMGEVRQMAVVPPGMPAKLEVRTIDVSRSADHTVFVLETARDGVPVLRECYSRDRTGVYREAYGPTGTWRITPPMPMLPLPLRPGSKWTWTGKLAEPDGAQKATATCSVTGPSLVHSKAGSFQAYEVAQQIRMGGADSETVVNRLWLAPKVGLVRQMTESGGSRTVVDLVRMPVEKK